MSGMLICHVNLSHKLSEHSKNSACFCVLFCLLGCLSHPKAMISDSEQMVVAMPIVYLNDKTFSQEKNEHLNNFPA